jgi:hypothetical protein
VGLVAWGLTALNALGLGALDALGLDDRREGDRSKAVEGAREVRLERCSEERSIGWIDDDDADADEMSGEEDSKVIGGLRGGGIGMGGGDAVDCGETLSIRACRRRSISASSSASDMSAKLKEGEAATEVEGRRRDVAEEERGGGGEEAASALGDDERAERIRSLLSEALRGGLISGAWKGSFADLLDEKTWESLAEEEGSGMVSGGEGEGRGAGGEAIGSTAAVDVGELGAGGIGGGAEEAGADARMGGEERLDV